jgi:GLPGLI family protein
LLPVSLTLINLNWLVLNLLACSGHLFLLKRKSYNMRTITLITSCLLIFSLAVKSQEPPAKSTTSGKIIYQEKVKIEIKLEGNAAQFENDLPKEQVSSKILYFNTDYSLYQPDNEKKEEDMMDQHAGGVNIRMMTSGGSDKTFCDFKTQEKSEQKEFMTRMFLVQGKMNSSVWKITSNLKSILGYNCQEAISEDTLRKTIAWFTTSIPVSTGPAGFGGLPGLILQIDMNDGRRVITATSIDPAAIDAALFIRPTEGKKVTPEEYKKIVEDKMKEMGAENGTVTNHVIIRYNN